MDSKAQLVLAYQTLRVPCPSVGFPLVDNSAPVSCSTISPSVVNETPNRPRYLLPARDGGLVV